MTITRLERFKQHIANFSLKTYDIMPNDICGDGSGLKVLIGASAKVGHLWYATSGTPPEVRHQIEAVIILTT